MLKRLLLSLALCAASCAAMATKPMPWVEAEIKKVQPDQGKVTLKHGSMEHLDMPPMTMTFRVVDREQLKTLTVGDKVRVAVVKVDGYYTVVHFDKGTPAP